jgi:hypothetical protein
LSPVEVGQDHDRELEALRLVDREDLDRVERLVGQRALALLLELADRLRGAVEELAQRAAALRLELRRLLPQLEEVRHACSPW